MNTTPKKSEKRQFAPLFTKPNMIIMGIGLVFLIASYVLMSGGGTDDPNEFSEKIFDTRRLTVAPVLLILGFLIEIVAIMYHPKWFKRNSEATDNTEKQS